MKKISMLAGAVALGLAAQGVSAAPANCDVRLKSVFAYDGLAGYAALQDALADVVASGPYTTGGLGFNMWLTYVDNDGTVCAVTKTGATGTNSAGTDAWLLSRVISAQKANTANGLSHDAWAISTGNLYNAVQPGVNNNLWNQGDDTNAAANGGSLFGLQESNPIDTDAAYLGAASAFGTSKDPMRNRRVGGVNVFGGGLAVYDADGNKVGAIGVSGDTSCEDHSVAWEVREALGLDTTPNDDSLNSGDEDSTEQTHPDCTGGVGAQDGNPGWENGD